MEDNTNSGNPVQGTEFSVEGFSVLQAGQLFFFTNTNSGNPVSGPEVRGRAGGGGPGRPEGEAAGGQPRPSGGGQAQS